MSLDDQAMPDRHVKHSERPKDGKLWPATNVIAADVACDGVGFDLDCYNTTVYSPISFLCNKLRAL